jgi:NAD(P)-dependent dehydrogenase (short-subunit alcohol dehydrogenase family)
MTRARFLGAAKRAQAARFLGAAKRVRKWPRSVLNVIAPFHLAEALADSVARFERRLIVNISSGMGSNAENTDGGSPIYPSSKAALNMVTKNLAIELRGQGVTVVALCPGWVRKDMGGKGAPLEAPKSVGSMRKVLAKLGVNDSGKFFNHTGNLMPW